MTETATPGRLARMLPDTAEGRRLALSSLVGSIGFGMYGPGSLLYFTRVVGLPVRSVGIGLSIAGLLGVALSVVVGRIVDRLGARRVAVTAGCTQFALLVAAVFAGNFGHFLLIVCLLATAEQAATVARGAVVAAVSGPDGRVRLAAQLRSTFNAGCTIGTLSGGVAFAFDTRAAYTAVLLVHAVLSLGSALLYLTIAASARTAAPPGTSRPRMARDVPYLAVAMLTGVVLLTDTVLGVGLPLWIATYTHAPRPLAGWLLTANALMVVALQTRASGGADTVPGARTVLRQAALLGAVSCPVFALSAGANTVLATCLLAIGTVALTLSELRGAAGGWGLRYGLAVEHAQGAYGGLFSLGAAVRLVAGPMLVTTLMANLHSAGWLVLAGLFLATAAVVPLVVNWAVSTRPVQQPSPAP